MPTGIYKRTEEYKRMRRESMIKKPNYGMKGKKHSEETKKKISQSNKGKIKTEEHKRKISDSMKGKIPKNMDLLKQKAIKFKKGIHPKTEFKKGYKPWNYIDGRSKIRSPNRYGDDWDKIRLLVYIRDRFICQDCGIKGIRLDVHHKIPFLILFDNSLRNLVSLCRSCHMKEERRITNELKAEVGGIIDGG